MEEKMLKNSRKGCWRRCDPLWLYAKLGEEVAAAIVLREGMKASEQDIRGFAATRLAYVRK